MAHNAPEIIEVTKQRREALLERAASGTLCDEDLELLRQILASYAEFFQIVGDKNTTIGRLRKLMFGVTSEKSKDVLGDTNADHAGDAPGVSGGETSDDAEGSEYEDPPEPAPGHGRHGADDYPGAEQVDVSHPELSAGDACPACGQGKLYEKAPGVLVRFVGRAPLHARVYRRQKLRCHLCGKLFTAPAPAGVGEDKYDHTVASLIGLLKYGSGLPFSWRRRCRCATDWRGICPGSSTPSWRTVWRMVAATLWNFMIGFPNSAGT